MTKSIQPFCNKPIKNNPTFLQELERTDIISIFNKFDTNQSGTISDNEIREQGYLKELFDSVKIYMTQIIDKTTILSEEQRAILTPYIEKNEKPRFGSTIFACSRLYR